MTPPRPRPPRDREPRRVAETRVAGGGMRSVSAAVASMRVTIPEFLAASRQSTASGSGFFKTLVIGFIGVSDLRFTEKPPNDFGAGRVNATTRAGVSFSKPVKCRGAESSVDMDARFKASARCEARDGDTYGSGKKAFWESRKQKAFRFSFRLLADFQYRNRSHTWGEGENAC